jgi:hypothetical protein
MRQTRIPESILKISYTFNKEGDKQNESKQFERIAKYHINSLSLGVVQKLAMEELKK